MKIALRYLALLLLATALTACRLEVPQFQAGTVSVYENGQVQRTWALRAEQIEALSHWLKQHQTGWQRSVVSYAPAFKLQLSQSNGGQSVVNILPSSVVVYGAGTQFEQTFSPEALAALKASLQVAP